jgi:hypothetical protein
MTGSGSGRSKTYGSGSTTLPFSIHGIYYKGIFFTSHNYFLTDLLRPPWSAAAPFSKTVLTKMGMSPWGEPKPPTIEKPRLCWPLHNTLSEIVSFVFSKVTELPYFTETISRNSLTIYHRKNLVYEVIFLAFQNKHPSFFCGQLNT